MYGKLIADVFSKLPADLLFKQVKGKTGNIRIKGRKHPGVACFNTGQLAPGMCYIYSASLTAY